MSDVVYGVNAVREALRGRRAVHRIHVAERRAGLDFLAGAGVPSEVATDRALTGLAGSEEHQGIVAETDPYPYADPADLVAGERPLLVALDEVTDPHNLGAIARTAECAGASGLVLPLHRSAAVTPAVCKVSAGAVEHLAIARVTNLADWLARAKGPRLWVYGLAIGASVDYTDADLADGAVLVIGAEGRGLRPRVRQACDEALRLPLHGRIGSLNASVAAGIVLYEAVRQRSARR
jgi:23S rRNA (guanosine2251-2'-O)-methyltransferase